MFFAKNGPVKEYQPIPIATDKQSFGSRFNAKYNTNPAIKDPTIVPKDKTIPSFQTPLNFSMFASFPISMPIMNSKMIKKNSNMVSVKLIFMANPNIMPKTKAVSMLAITLDPSL